MTNLLPLQLWFIWWVRKETGVPPIPIVFWWPFMFRLGVTENILQRSQNNTNTIHLFACVQTSPISFVARVQQRNFTINPLSPNIKIQILHTGVHTLPYRISWENLIKDQSTSRLFINLLLLLTFSIDNVLILLRENSFWSLLGLRDQSG